MHVFLILFFFTRIGQTCRSTIVVGNIVHVLPPPRRWRSIRILIFALEKSDAKLKKKVVSLSIRCLFLAHSSFLFHLLHKGSPINHHNLMLLPNCSPANDPLKTNEIPSIILYFETIKTKYNHSLTCMHPSYLPISPEHSTRYSRTDITHNSQRANYITIRKSIEPADS